MNGRNKAARIFVTIGSVVLFASAALHSIGAYPKLSAALSASTLDVHLQAALRAIFLSVGWDWIVIAIIALIAAFTATKLRKMLVLICGFAVLVETGLTLAFIGPFIGNELIGSAAVLLIVGGLLFQNVELE
jgi:hypothetical protein